MGPAVKDSDDDLTSSDEEGKTTTNQPLPLVTSPAAHTLYEEKQVSVGMAGSCCSRGSGGMATMTSPRPPQVSPPLCKPSCPTASGCLSDALHHRCTCFCF